MLAKALKKIRQRLSLLFMVAVVLLAAYVSLGRQFMPAVAGYTQFFEQQLSTLSGVPIRIESISGGFEGFNPVLTISGLRLRVGDTEVVGPDLEAVYFESARISVDIPRSIWRRQWVLEDFSVENLEINLEQTTDGGWRLQGITMGGGQAVELDSVYESFLSISRLDINNVSLNVQTNQGDRYRFTDGSASIRNQDATHYLYLSAFPQNNRAAISAAFEVEGQRLEQMSGRLHLDIPVGNYTEIAAQQYGDEFSILELVGGAGVWASIEAGEISEIVFQPQISRLKFKGPYSQGTTLQQINGVIKTAFDDNVTTINLSDMYLSWAGINWLDFQVATSIDAGNSISITADELNLSLLAGILAASGLLDETVQKQIDSYAPKGLLNNFRLTAALSEGELQNLQLVSNIAKGSMQSVAGAPNLSGIDGYVQLNYDAQAKRAEGFGEVESQNFSINIPNVFTSNWEYSYANGSLDFSVDLNDGEDIRLVSSVVAAQSAAVDAHVQFASHLRRYPDGRREAELDLLVGTSRMDAKDKALYLPDGPTIDDGLRRSMQWVDLAVKGGDITNAGVLYRGSTIPGAPSAAKTFQGYFQLADGDMVFSEQWPPLSDLSAYLYVDDNDIDISVASAQSMGLALEGATGTIRRNAQNENWLSLTGQANGGTAAGLVYLQNAGVNDQIKNAFNGWEATGNLDAAVTLGIPLNDISSGTDVRIELSLSDNDLFIPEYALQFEQVAGDVVFDTVTGVETTQLAGTLFSNPIDITLSSNVVDGKLETVFVDGEGSARPEQLVEWPLQSDFVANILGYADGLIGFSSRLSLEQSESSTKPNVLHIESQLQQTSFSLPEPFAKVVGTEMPLILDVEFGEQQRISGSFGDNLGFRLGLNGGVIDNGLVYLSETQTNLENLAASPTEGVAIVGDLAYLKLEQWTQFLDGFGGQASRNEMDSMIAFVDVQLDQLEMYEQLLPDVAVRIELHPVLSSWTVDLASTSIKGQVDIPFSEDDYLLIDLEYLKLPSDEEDLIATEEQIAIEESEGEAVDALATIDPRTLPKMIFSTEEFSIGPRPYGSWRFQLDPSPAGAELTDLAFDFRGLRLELPEEVSEEEASIIEPHFLWAFDGVEHRSELAGLITAGNMADVLRANGLAAVFESNEATFRTNIQWPGSPAFFAASGLSGSISMDIRDGRFLQNAGGNGALKLISIINFDAIMRRLRFSDDLLRRGLAYDQITADLLLEDGQVAIQDRLVISGPSSLYQITGDLDLAEETISGELYVTLPVSRNIPWIGVLTANIPLAVGAYLFDRIFGDQVNSLTSAVYTLEGSWEDLEPEFKQAFGAPAEAGAVTN